MEHFKNIPSICARQKSFAFYILCPLSKNMGNMHFSLANQIAYIFTCNLHLLCHINLIQNCACVKYDWRTQVKLGADRIWFILLTQF